MKFKLLAMTALCGVFAVACGKSSSDTSSSGGGDSGGGGVGGSSNVTTASMNTTSSSMLGSCEETYPVCGGDGQTAGCIDCALTDDPTIATDAGVCLDTYETCFGTDPATACGTGGDPACCDFNDCLGACPEDNTATADVDEFLECVCTVDAASGSCAMLDQQTDPNTCMGAANGTNAVQEYFTIIDCFYGDGQSTTGACGNVCGG